MKIQMRSGLYFLLCVFSLTGLGDEPKQSQFNIRIDPSLGRRAEKADKERFFRLRDKLRTSSEKLGGKISMYINVGGWPGIFHTLNLQGAPDTVQVLSVEKVKDFLDRSYLPAHLRKTALANHPDRVSEIEAQVAMLSDKEAPLNDRMDAYLKLMGLKNLAVSAPGAGRDFLQRMGVDIDLRKEGESSDAALVVFNHEKLAGLAELKLQHLGEDLPQVVQDLKTNTIGNLEGKTVHSGK